MKWVVGSIAVLVALVAGVAIGWIARGRQDARAHHHAHTAYTYVPPPPPVPTPVSPAPSVTSWTEDPEAYAWPPGPTTADITAVDATHYVVRRSYLDYVLQNQATLLRTARIVPELVDGGPARIRVFGVRPGTTPSRFGFLNGDALESVNGLPLGAPENALEAYTRLSKAERVVVHVERHGSPLDLHYLLAP